MKLRMRDFMEEFLKAGKEFMFWVLRSSDRFMNLEFFTMKSIISPSWIKVYACSFYRIVL